MSLFNCRTVKATLVYHQPDGSRGRGAVPEPVGVVKQMAQKTKRTRGDTSPDLRTPLVCLLWVCGRTALSLCSLLAYVSLCRLIGSVYTVCTLYHRGLACRGLGRRVGRPLLRLLGRIHDRDAVKEDDEIGKGFEPIHEPL